MKSIISTLLVATTSLVLMDPASAQVRSQLAVPNSPAYEEAATILREQPAQEYNFSKALLGDVLRLLAEDAGISFFGLPEGTPGADRLVTFTLRSSPFIALETIARANGISLIHEQGIWYLRPANDRELVGRIYQINYNSQELVRKNGQQSTPQQSSSSSGGGGIGSSSIGLNLQGAPDFFVTEPSRLLDDIRSILDLPTTGGVAHLAPTASVDTFAQLSARNLAGQPELVISNESGPDGGPDEAESRAKVIWNSDSNSLYVVATRQQHQWIEGYLAAADQPQPLIAVEVRFLEMNKDPRTELGLDWTGTLGDGYGATLGNLNTTVDLNRLGDTMMPGTAILSFEDVNVKLRALFDDRKTKVVSYPRMITLDNREVVFRSVVNQPVLASSSATSLGAGATETTSVEYVPIGTVINLLPKRMADGKVLLNISITLSDIIGTEFINGNPFPIASSRVYTAPVQVESGYTVAISGLDQAVDDRTDTGIPLLGRIPVIGYAFKFKNDSRSRQHLMMMITPTLIGPDHPGVSHQPSIEDRWIGPKDYQEVQDSVPLTRDRIPPQHQFQDAHYHQPSAAVQPVESGTREGQHHAAVSVPAESAAEAKTPRRSFFGRLFAKRRDRSESPSSSSPAGERNSAETTLDRGVVRRVEATASPQLAATANSNSNSAPAVKADTIGKVIDTAEDKFRKEHAAVRPARIAPIAAARQAQPAPVQTRPARAEADSVAEMRESLARLEDTPRDRWSGKDRRRAEQISRDSRALMEKVNPVEGGVDPNNREWWDLLVLKTKADQLQSKPMAPEGLADRGEAPAGGE